MAEGARMSYWIAYALRKERERWGIAPSKMAQSLDVSAKTITRLEAGETMGRDIDYFVSGYAYVLGIEDGRDLWRSALEAWQKQGSPPLFLPIEGPVAAFCEAIRIQVLRQRRDDVSPSERRRASR